MADLSKKNESLEMKETPGASQKKENSIGHKARWEKMFQKLIQFKEENGHCLVPNRYRDDPSLGTWVATQRRQFKALVSGSKDSTPLSQERKRRLQIIGFDFSPKDQNALSWEAQFLNFVKFMSKNGHGNVPENSPLGSWMSKQRHDYQLLQKGIPSRLNEERVKLLRDTGFVFDPEEAQSTNISSTTMGDSDIFPISVNRQESSILSSDSFTDSGCLLGKVLKQTDLDTALPNSKGCDLLNRKPGESIAALYQGEYNIDKSCVPAILQRQLNITANKTARQRYIQQQSQGLETLFPLNLAEQAMHIEAAQRSLSSFRRPMSLNPLNQSILKVDNSPLNFARQGVFKKKLVLPSPQYHQNLLATHKSMKISPRNSSTEKKELEQQNSALAGHIQEIAQRKRQLLLSLHENNANQEWNPPKLRKLFK